MSHADVFSPSAPRARAPWHRVARAESAALWRPGPALLTLGVVIALTLGPFGSGQWTGPLSEIRDLAVLMFFFPLLHWRGRIWRGPLDQALPVDAVRYELIRIACGAAAALVTLALATGLNLLVMGGRYAGQGGLPREYPAALVVAGMAFYLFGAAVALRAERPGRMLLAIVLPLLLALQLSGVRLWEWGRATNYARDGRVTSQTVFTALTLQAALLWLAAAVAAAGLSAWLAGSGRGGWVPGRMRIRRSLPAVRRPRVPATGLDMLRAPAPPAAVAMRQFAVQASRMGVPLGLAALYAAWCLWRETRGGGTFLAGGAWPIPFVFAGFFWPVLVWQEERRGRDWDELHPVPTLTRRLLHAAAGLVWLQAAVLLVVAASIAGAMAEGTLQSPGQVPAWVMPGLPMAVAGLYCLGTAWAMVSEHPIRTAVMGFLVTTQLLLLLDMARGGEPFELSPSRAFAPLRFLGAPVQDHSMQATVLWIGISIALACVAIRRRARRDLHGGFAMALAPR